MAGGSDTGKVPAQNVQGEELDLFEELDAPRNTGSDEGKEDADDIEYGREADFHAQYQKYLQHTKQNHDDDEDGDRDSQIGNSYANEQRLAGATYDEENKYESSNQTLRPYDDEFTPYAEPYKLITRVREGTRGSNRGAMRLLNNQKQAN